MVRYEKNFIITSTAESNDEGKPLGITIDGTIYGLHKNPTAFFVSDDLFMIRKPGLNKWSIFRVKNGSLLGSFDSTGI